MSQGQVWCQLIQIWNQKVNIWQQLGKIWILLAEQKTHQRKPEALHSVEHGGWENNILSFWEGLFFRAMLVLVRVYNKKRPQLMGEKNRVELSETSHPDCSCRKHPRQTNCHICNIRMGCFNSCCLTEVVEGRGLTWLSQEALRPQRQTTDARFSYPASHHAYKQYIYILDSPPGTPNGWKNDGDCLWIQLDWGLQFLEGLVSYYILKC